MATLSERFAHGNRRVEGNGHGVAHHILRREPFAYAAVGRHTLRGSHDHSLLSLVARHDHARFRFR